MEFAFDFNVGMCYDKTKDTTMLLITCSSIQKIWAKSTYVQKLPTMQNT